MTDEIIIHSAVSETKGAITIKSMHNNALIFSKANKTKGVKLSTLSKDFLQQPLST